MSVFSLKENMQLAIAEKRALFLLWCLAFPFYSLPLGSCCSLHAGVRKHFYFRDWLREGRDECPVWQNNHIVTFSWVKGQLLSLPKMAITNSALVRAERVKITERDARYTWSSPRFLHSSPLQHSNIVNFVAAASRNGQMLKSLVLPSEKYDRKLPLKRGPYLSERVAVFSLY